MSYDTRPSPRTDAVASQPKRDAAMRWDMEELARTLERELIMWRDKGALAEQELRADLAACYADFKTATRLSNARDSENDALRAALVGCVTHVADYERMTDECAAAFRQARAALAGQHLDPDDLACIPVQL